MNIDIQKKIIESNISLIKKCKSGFINNYCNSIKNQIINNISICDKFEDNIETGLVRVLHNIEHILL